MRLRQYIESLEHEIIHDVSKIIEIPSVIEDELPNKPFGKPIDDALEWLLNRCEAIGMRVYKDPDGYYGYAEVGEGATMIGILGHIDVVPSGAPELWKHAPFKGVVDSGFLYGRGAIDDKGPLISVLYAIKALLALETPLRKRIRLIIGTDEENMWRGINAYLKKEEIPSYAFTPDSTFPIVFAEKGLLQIRLKNKSKNEPLVKGGASLNAVPESAIYSGDQSAHLERALKKFGFDFEHEQNEIVVVGKSAHSSTPNQGINAIVRLALSLQEMGHPSKTIDFISNRIGLTNNGELIFGNCYDEVSGKLTLSLNQIDLSKHGASLGIDIRIPVTVDKKFIVDGIKRVASKYKLEYEELDWLPPVYLPHDHFLIEQLKAVFQEETGLDSQPISTGGATYARAIPNCVAFGPLFPGQKKMAHKTDEYIEIKSLIKMTQIYAKALERLLMQEESSK